MTDAKVTLWGSQIGAVSWLEDQNLAVFQYHPDFLFSHIELSPLMMPLQEAPYSFPALPQNSFRGLPGLLADSLPDKFGNAVIDAWLATQGRRPDSFNSVERLCYIGSRGMGGLEYKPALFEKKTRDKEIDLARLVELSNQVLDQRSKLHGILASEDSEAMRDILRVGTSAGGARAKAVLAWNPTTNEFRSGQVPSQPGFEDWILKFDGVRNNRDKELADPQGYGKIEYAYYEMATEVGIKMTRCRLHHEGGRSHFMTKRFDRDGTGGKIHMLSLAAMAHLDYNLPAAYSYEEAIQVMKRLELPREDIEQQILRAMFNVVGRNQDDHVKNIAFLMNRVGEWRLSPAFDVIYAYNPNGAWTNGHQMTIQGKRDQIFRMDLISLAGLGGIKPRRANEMLDKVIMVCKQWDRFAGKAGVDEGRMLQIQNALRLDL